VPPVSGSTAINLRWLLSRNDPQEYKRFRADSFATWLKCLEQTAAETHAGPQADALAARLQVHIDAELAAAGLTRAVLRARLVARAAYVSLAHGAGRSPS
jgi:hypothetical protein